jgi:hypothetical protein
MTKSPGRPKKSPTKKRSPGRPKKSPTKKRSPGRPKKSPTKKRGPGRPKKSARGNMMINYNNNDYNDIEKKFHDLVYIYALTNGARSLSRLYETSIKRKRPQNFQSYIRFMEFMYTEYTKNILPTLGRSANPKIEKRMKEYIEDGKTMVNIKDWEKGGNGVYKDMEEITLRNNY